MAELHLRSEWIQKNPPWTPARHDVGDIFIHHEGGAARGVPADVAREAAILRELEAGVLHKGYIATDYNLHVFNSGRVWEGRGLAHEDAATWHNNPTSVSICATGNYEREEAPDALIAGIARAVEMAIAGRWVNPTPRIRPHREVYPTACPGRNLYARLGDIRAAVGHPVDQTTPPLEEAAKVIPKTFIREEGDQWYLPIWTPTGPGAIVVNPGEAEVWHGLGFVLLLEVQKVPKATIEAMLARAA